MSDLWPAHLLSHSESLQQAITEHVSYVDVDFTGDH